MGLEICLKEFYGPRDEVVTMSEDVSELQRKILELILKDSHRPAAITRILKRRNSECNQNEVVLSLNDLEKRDLVERFTGKTWIAKSKAEDYVE